METKELTGRDLDAEIVKTIFKWQQIPVSSDANGMNACSILFPPNEKPTQELYNQMPLIGKLHEGWYAPRYSTHLETAIELAKYLNLPMDISEINSAHQISVKCLKWYNTHNKP